MKQLPGPDGGMIGTVHRCCGGPRGAVYTLRVATGRDRQSRMTEERRRPSGRRRAANHRQGMLMSDPHCGCPGAAERLLHVAHVHHPAGTVLETNGDVALVKGALAVSNHE